MGDLVRSEVEAGRHRHEIEGGFIEHDDHDLGSGAAALDPIPFEGHRHLVVLCERNYVNEESGPAARAWLAEGNATTTVTAGGVLCYIAADASWTPEAGSLSTDSAKSVWIVGKFGEPWELMGAFDSQKEALDAARDGEFVGRVPMGRAPDETVDFIDVRVVQK